MKFNRLDRNYDGDVGLKKKLLIFSHTGRPLGMGKVCNLETCEREQAHLYVLKNCKEVEFFFQVHVKLSHTINLFLLFDCDRRGTEQ